MKDAASASERKKFIALAEYFQKYGDQYDVDFLLMAAQGYQESRLDQDVVSKVGAIGVMQVMPATGKDFQILYRLPADQRNDGGEKADRGEDKWPEQMSFRKFT